MSGLCRNRGLIPLDEFAHSLHVLAMTSSAVIKDSEFKLVTEFVQPDAKKRLSLGDSLAGGAAYNIYRNTLGQLILDPVKTIPLSEAWLWEDPAAIGSVRRGLEQVARGETHDLGDFSGFATP